jgi:hydrogenase-4 component H
VLKLFREVLRVGKATTSYPFAPVEVSPGFRGRPIHDAARCIACAACVVACPPNALAVETDTEAGIRTWEIFYGRCIFCGRCEEVCPAGAIALSPEFELAVFRREDLIARAEYALQSCRVCGAYFAPVKELAYALELLRLSGVPEAELDGRRETIETCPECRRKADVQRIRSLPQEEREWMPVI